MEELIIRIKRILLAALVAGCAIVVAEAQTVVSIGGGSCASYPPNYKGKTEDHSGFNATKMLSRKIYLDEIPSRMEGALEIPGRPIPTNDWWTDVLASRYSGAIWSYPAMLRTSEEGVEIHYPSYWADKGKEIKSRSHITVGGLRYKADSTIAADWGDWHVVMRMPDAGNEKEMRITSAHGSPFTWFEFSNMSPELRFSSTPRIFGKTSTHIGISLGEEKYAIYYPCGTVVELNDGTLQFESGCRWMVAALLRSEEDLTFYEEYASSVPRSTNVSWNYEESTSTLATNWKVEARNLRNPRENAPVIQGFLPHAYKYALSGANLVFDGGGNYMTPRGDMKMAVSPSGDFSYSYRFSGMLPAYASPLSGDSETDGYDPGIMKELMESYSESGSFGGDTYWGGKGLTQMALNMMFAKESGETEIYENSRKRLREAFENWLNYTPGEDTFFFSYYPRWGAMLGFDVSYDSDAFNDHHFHYGYFTYAASLLCLEDRDFAEKYGEMLTMIAKDYANWDKTDGRFPFMRTMDPWCGYSWAGGLGDAGNDNGNGQESTSEAMQGWGGVYLLGVALGDKEMRDAGIFGWNTEARATREYWYDVDGPRPENEGGREAWPGKGEKTGNYDYNEYPYAYNSNITGKGIGWWTWFGGDPLFMHGIQWMPISPALDYLSWDTDFAAWAYRDMMSGANSSFSHKWFEPTFNSDNGELIEPLAYNDWGNVTLSYLQRSDPQQAASIFARAWKEGLHIAKGVSTSHISYFVIHNHLTYGDPDFNVYADIPTAQCYVKDGQRIFMVYNPGEEERRVNFRNAGGMLLRSVKSAPGRLTVFTDEAKPSCIKAESSIGNIIPAGGETILTARLLDQYGCEIDGSGPMAISLESGTPAKIVGNSLIIDRDAHQGEEFKVIFRSWDILTELELTVNDIPQVESARIEGVDSMVECETPLNLCLIGRNQYGEEKELRDAKWTLISNSGEEIGISDRFIPVRPGNYILRGEDAESGVKAEESLFVTPPMPLISGNAFAVGSSSENVGCKPENVNDGDLLTRWGSAHTDDEWIMLDLGEDCFISRIAVDWEAAYAAAYDIEVAPSGCVLTMHTGNYAGVEKTVELPAESSWTRIISETASSSGEKTSILGAMGRYVRIHGKVRATGYGYSIHEMRIFGLNGSVGENDILGIDFELPVVAEQNEEVQLTPTAFTRSGENKEVRVKWSSDKDADFRDNIFIPTSYGKYVITATTPEGISTSASVFVNEAERMVSIELSAENLTMIEGESVRVIPTAINQFGAPYRKGTENLDIRVLDEDGNVSHDGVYETATGVFMTQKAGNYAIAFGDLARCNVAVIALKDANLALNKPAAASSVRDGNKATRANDGNNSTRWESEWTDNQWLSIDLEGKYEIDRMEIDWEGAFAREYRIQISTDGKAWEDIYSEKNSKGSKERFSFSPVEASYVRLCCDKRALENYGFSLYEWRVYGLRKIDSPLTGIDSLTQENGTEMYFDMSGRMLPAPPASGIFVRVSGGKAEVMMK